MKKYFFLSSLIIMALLFFSLQGCGDNSTGPTDNEETVTTTIFGTVLDENNNPVVGAEVKSAGKTTVSNNFGGFVFSNIKVPKSRFVVNATKNGYFRGSIADAPTVNGTKTIKVFMIASGLTETVNSSSGGLVELGNGTSVQLNPNSLTAIDGSAFNGSVNVSIAHLDPTSENFYNLIPGGDFLAQRSDNSMSTLYSYGIIKVDLRTDSGDKLQIKSGDSSQIVVHIPSSMLANAPAAIPLWFYDDKTGIWMEEGEAVKQGDKYVGKVSHFSDWNCDVPEGTSTVKGLVVDCNQIPVPGVVVKVGQASVVTDANGQFERRVPANTAFEIQVLPNRNFGLTSNVVSITPLTAGSVKDVGTLQVDCPAYVKGQIKCNNTILFGQVIISWDGGYNSQFTDADGKFNIPADIEKNAEVNIYTVDGKYKNLTITTPSVRGQTLDLGVIEVCDQVILGDNKFTLNGGGFNNRTFTFSSDSNFVYGYYDQEDSLTIVWMYQIFQTDTVMFWTSFKGTSVGAGTDVVFYLYHNSHAFLGSSEIPNASANVNISNYNGVGGLIEGTFNGVVMEATTGAGSITISDGHFSVVRIVAPREKKQIEKIREIRKRYNLK